MNLQSITIALAGIALLGTGIAARAETRPGERILLAQAAQRPSAATAQAELDALIKAAKAEGEVNHYSCMTDNVVKRVSDAFFAKYGIRSGYVRLSGTGTLQRYATEAEAGNFGADAAVICGTSALPVAEEWAKKGWVEPITAATSPVIRSGEYPASLVRGPIALIQIAVWRIAYNTEKLKGADVPKDWPDLLNPKLKGQILVPELLSGGAAFLEFYGMLHDRYGDAFFEKLRSQDLKVFAGAVPAIQALGAGEGAIYIPAVTALTGVVKDKGAPVDQATPAYNTGVENFAMITHRAKAKRPAAGRLFANFIMSPEGNKLVNQDPGGITVYETKGLPAQYRAPDPNASTRTAQLQKLLAR